MASGVTDSPMGDDTAVADYIAERRRRVDGFVLRHFSVPGTLALLRRTFVKDLAKYPINFFLALPFLVVKNVADWLEMLGWDQLSQVLERLPVPLKTEHQATIERLVVDELLELAPGPARDCLAQPLKTYRASRLTVLDGLNSGATLLAAYMLFGDSSISPYAMGDRLAREQAKRDSAASFFLGRSAGSVFYGVFPPHPSFWQICLATGTVVLGLGALATSMSMIADPLLQLGGVHKRQLLRLLDAFEDRLLLHATKTGREPVAAALLSPLDLGDRPEATRPPETAVVADVLARSSAQLQNAAGVLRSATLTAGAATKRWTAQSSASVASSYRRAETRFGRRRIIGVMATSLAIIVVLGLVIADQLRFDPYREARALIEARAFPTAVARLDGLARNGSYREQAEYWYLRGQALMGERAYDAGADAYRSAMQREPAYRDDAKLMRDLVLAVAKASNAKAKNLLLSENGPNAVSALADQALAAEKIDRWAVVDIAEKLGGADELDYPTIILTDLQYATTCAEKKRALQKVAERHISKARDALEELDAQPQWKCLQPTLRSVLVDLASR